LSGVRTPATSVISNSALRTVTFTLPTNNYLYQSPSTTNIINYRITVADGASNVAQRDFVVTYAPYDPVQILSISGENQTIAVTASGTVSVNINFLSKPNFTYSVVDTQGVRTPATSVVSNSALRTASFTLPTNNYLYPAPSSTNVITYRATVTDGSANVAQRDFLVTYAPFTQLSVVPDVSNVSIIPPNSRTLTATASNGRPGTYAYSWRFDGCGNVLGTASSLAVSNNYLAEDVSFNRVYRCTVTDGVSAQVEY
jgi:hypothetical protein